MAEQALTQPSSNLSSLPQGVVVIGASTGGPAALEELLQTFPANTACAVIVAQHLPETFADSFVARLGKVCSLPVVKMSVGLPIQAGTIYIAPGGMNVRIVSHPSHQITTQCLSTNEIQSPSIDVVMTSAAAVFKSQTVGVVLTGMGSDGLEGMRTIKQSGGATIVQSAESCVVYGMGKQVVEAGLADAILPLAAIANHALYVLQTHSQQHTTL